MEDKLNISFQIGKNQNPMMFEKISKIGDLTKYFEYLINLDYVLNGTDQEYSVVPTKIYTASIADSLDYVLHNLQDYVDELDKAIPDEYRMVFYGPEEGIINIPDDALFENLKREVIKLSQLIDLLKNRKVSD